MSEPEYSPPTNLTYRSTKTYTHSVGLSCAFRQWRAKESHCSFIHGYALQVKLTFEGPLDKRNWVMDFGGLKKVKKWLEDTFDHKLLVAEDDPEKLRLGDMSLPSGISDVLIVEHVGVEMFAKMILLYVDRFLFDTNATARIIEVEVCEHEGNSAICRR